MNDYIYEKGLFYLLNLICTNQDSLVCTDNESYLMGRSNLGLPTWIWTKDNLSEESYRKVKEDIKKYLVDKENKFTCKKELYEKLSQEFDTDNYFEMGYLECKELKEIENKKGLFDKADYSDKMVLARFWQDNCREMDKENIELSAALETVNNWIEEGNFYVLRDGAGKAVCMAGYSTLDEYAKITHVYTERKERGKHYCTSLIYYLTKELIEKGYKPMLYTDFHYEASNKAYNNVGFENEGILINFIIRK